MPKVIGIVIVCPDCLTKTSIRYISEKLPDGKVEVQVPRGRKPCERCDVAISMHVRNRALEGKISGQCPIDWVEVDPVLCDFCGKYLGTTEIDGKNLCTGCITDIAYIEKMNKWGGR